MSYTPTDEQIETAARALARTDAPGRQAYIDARAVLVAVGPSIQAGALREAAEACEDSGPWVYVSMADTVRESEARRLSDDEMRLAEWLNRRADAIENGRTGA